ncbi:jg23797 [Pararge aegeria aegeria]|uniref:Jg23797 protein n=1 Tax=Pararge aegeria aegeria TaxID=348720 RepID=A0A8S4SP37_9NEOP|nr:jg23797 [Pararge aegeria aegeria]
METEETPIHVMLQCNGVTEQRAAHLGSSATLQEALGDLGGLLSFWNQPSAEKAQKQKKKKNNSYILLPQVSHIGFQNATL